MNFSSLYLAFAFLNNNKSNLVCMFTHKIFEILEVCMKQYSQINRFMSNVFRVNTYEDTGKKEPLKKAQNNKIANVVGSV